MRTFDDIIEEKLGSISPEDFELIAAGITSFEVSRELRIMVSRRMNSEGETLWAVTSNDLDVVDRNLNAIYEPSPSNRTEAFIQETRFSLQDAIRIARRFAEKEKSERDRFFASLGKAKAQT